MRRRSGDTRTLSRWAARAPLRKSHLEGDVERLAHHLARVEGGAAALERPLGLRAEREGDSLVGGDAEVAGERREVTGSSSA